MREFWWHGFEASGVQSLLDTMGIGRQSLYNAFGGKRELYAEALDRYGRTRLSYLVDLLAEGGPSIGLIHDALERWARAAAAPPRPGCLLANTLGSDVGSADIVRPVAERHVRRLRSAFATVLADGVEAGEVRPDIGVSATADQLVTLGLGLTLRARSGASITELRSIVDAALAGIAKPGPTESTSSNPPGAV